MAIFHSRCLPNPTASKNVLYCREVIYRSTHALRGSLQVAHTLFYITLSLLHHQRDEIQSYLPDDGSAEYVAENTCKVIRCVCVYIA